MKRIIALLFIISFPLYAGPKNKKRDAPLATPKNSVHIQGKTKSEPGDISAHCNTTPEERFTKHVFQDEREKLPQDILTKLHQSTPETTSQKRASQSIIIPSLDLSSSEQATPSTLEEEVLNIKRMFEHCDTPSVFADIDARNRYPLKLVAYARLFTMHELLAEKDGVKRHCPEKVIE